MKKINKYFLALITAFSLILSSCGDLSDDSGEKTVQKEKSPFGGISCIKVLLDSASVEEARTAFPDFTTEDAADKESRYAGFTQFYLEGTRNSGSTKVSKTWTQTVENGTVTKTAYQALLDDQYIPLTYPPMEPPENWEFTLKGYYGGTFDTDGNLEDGSFILFEGKKTIETAQVGEVNEVSFELSRTSKYVFDAEKKGSLAITLNCGESSGVSTIKAKLYKAGDTETPVNELTLVYATEKIYEVAELPEGQYYADFELYGKDSANREIFICSTREYAYVINNLASTSTLNIDPNGTFIISYKYNDGTSDVGFASLFASGYNAPSQYTRLSEETTLPVTGDFDPENDFIKNHIFLGWYEASDTSFANRITKIEKKSRVGNLDLKARFVHKNEVPTVLGVKFTYDEGVTATADDGEHPLSGLLKVGHKITATPYYNDGSSDTDFLGTIAKWEWYCGDTLIAASNVTTTDTSAEDSTAATSSIWLKPDYAEKTITVKVVQKNTITETAADSGIFNISENITSGQVADGKTKSTEAGTVAKGTLHVKDNFELKYNKSTAVECGSALSNDVLNQDVDSIVKTYICDDNNQSSDNWTLSGLEINPTLAFAEGVALVAPNEETGSKHYDAVLKAAGYNDLALSGINGAFINVKYKKPTSAILPVVLWGTANPGSVDSDKIRDCINKGNVAFMRSSYTSYYSRTIYCNEKATPTVSDDAATMAAFDSTCQISSSGLKLGIKNNSVSNPDAKGFNIGYIADSDPYTPTAEELSGYIGTREKIASISIISDKQVGKGISLKICDASGNQITQYKDINWTLKFGSTEYSSDGATSTSRTINQADFNDGSGQVSATAVRNYPVLGNRTITLSATSITKGTMNTPSFSYAGPAKKSGDSVTMTELSPSTFTSNTDANSGAQIVCSTSVGTVNAEDGAATGSVSVKISASGYDDKTVTVTGIPIKPNPPAVGENQEVTVTDPVTGAQTTVTLKKNSLKEGDDLKTVSIGHVAFNATLAPTYAYEFTRTYCEFLKNYYERMTMDQLTAVYITKTAEAEDTRTQTLIDNIQQEFDLCHETGWHSIPVDTNGDGCFEKPLVSEHYNTSIGQSQFISLRSKMKGLVDGLYENIVYYDTGTNTWHDADYNNKYTAIEFSSDGTTCTVKDSEGREHTVNIQQHASEVVNVPYDSSNNGIRGIKNAIVTVEKADLRLSGTRNGGNVTFKLADGLTKKFTITRWKVDGMSVANFKTSEGISTGVVEVLGSSGTEAKLEFTLSDLKDGTYQITAYGTDEYGIEHIGGASIVVSN